MTTFTIGEHDFLLDGAPFRILSGSIHYFRVHEDLWADRIHKAKLMGLNTIETYVAWNEHAPVRGQFDTAGRLDLARFLDLVAEAGMYAIVRPGPFICAEWDNGGFPGWLFTDPAVGVRRSEPLYIEAVSEFMGQLLPIVAPRQVSNGGPVILVQIENEYGAYGNDKDYLRTLVDLTRGGGISVPLTTIDQPTDQMLDDGSLPELHKTASFGSRAVDRFAALRRHQPTGPLMCAEFWNGWFDHWGAHHHTTSATDAANELDALLATGASVNLYMFHGGTNFAFTNGANDKGVFQPTVTSYDYDSPLTESGEITEKYRAFRDVIARYAPVPAEIPPAASAAAEFSVTLGERMPLWDAVAHLGQWVASETLPTMDEQGQFRGFALYRTQVDARDEQVLSFGEVRDRVQVFVDAVPVGVLQRDHHDASLALPAVSGRLDLLVEDQGRVNYGPRIGEDKGLIGQAWLGDLGASRAVQSRVLRDWQVLALDLGVEGIAALSAQLSADPVVGSVSGPSIARGSFEAAAGADLFVSTVGWGKGHVWINGFNLGRYWSRGPQTTLYVPGPLLRDGANDIIVFELHGSADAVVRFVAGPELGHTDF